MSTIRIGVLARSTWEHGGSGPASTMGPKPPDIIIIRLPGVPRWNVYYNLGYEC